MSIIRSLTEKRSKGPVHIYPLKSVVREPAPYHFALFIFNFTIILCKACLTQVGFKFNINVKLALLSEVNELENRLRQLREQTGITQEDLAARVNVSRQTIISLEKGKYNPSIILAYKLAQVFSLPIEAVFVFEDGEE